MNFIEIIGYLASVLIAISLTMSNILKLRVINLIGAITFTIYGFFIGAIPIFLVNGFIVFIDLYYLIKMFRESDSFDTLKILDDRRLLDGFLNFHKKDIINFFPELDFDKRYEGYFILRNMQPVNLVLYNLQDNGIIEIILDYTIPKFRDFLNGHYMLKSIRSIIDIDGDLQLVVKSTSKAHIGYLSKLGFIKNDMGLYVYKLKN